MRISDWSSDVCSSDLITLARDIAVAVVDEGDGRGRVVWTVRTILEPEQRARDDVTKERGAWVQRHEAGVERVVEHTEERGDRRGDAGAIVDPIPGCGEFEAACGGQRSEEHTSELQSPMRNSYAVVCMTKNT